MLQCCFFWVVFLSAQAKLPPHAELGSEADEAKTLIICPVNDPDKHQAGQRVLPHPSCRESPGTAGSPCLEPKRAHHLQPSEKKKKEVAMDSLVKQESAKAQKMPPDSPQIPGASFQHRAEHTQPWTALKSGNCWVTGAHDVRIFKKQISSGFISPHLSGVAVSAQNWIPIHPEGSREVPQCGETLGENCTAWNPPVHSASGSKGFFISTTIPGLSSLESGFLKIWALWAQGTRIFLIVDDSLESWQCWGALPKCHPCNAAAHGTFFTHLSGISEREKNQFCPL